MSDWLTIELVLTVLLVTTFTSVGLVALWAASSPRHWFVRVAVVLGVLSPLLLIPAFEPFVALVVETAIIIVAMMSFRGWTNRFCNAADSSHASDRSVTSPLRFSLSTLLLLFFLAAVVAAVTTKLPRLNFNGWLTIVLNGVAGGIAVVVGAWMIVSRRKLIAWSFGVVVCLTTGALLAMFDWFMPSITDLVVGWPPDDTNGAAFLGITDSTHPVIEWYFIPVLVATGISFLAFCWQSAPAFVTADENRACAQRTVSRRWRGAAIVLALLLAAFPLFVLGELLTPDPIPESAIPASNAYDDFVAAGTEINSSQFDFDVASPQQIAAELSRCAEAFEIFTGALEKPCVVPVDYSSGASLLPMDHLMAFRATSRALCAKAKRAKLAGHTDNAAHYLRQTIDFGYSIRRGGLLIDSLVGMACSGAGARPLFAARETLSSDELDRCIALLVQLDAADESYEDVWLRDRAWSQRAYGWHGHLQQLLSEIVDHSYDLIVITTDQYSTTYWTNQASVRLLIVELALARFYKDHGRWPLTIDELIPSYLKSIPIDPLDPDGGQLRYRFVDDSYILYSVGPNCVDDEGAAPVEDDLRGLPQTGDLRLDAYFAPDEIAQRSVSSNREINPAEDVGSLEDDDASAP